MPEHHSYILISPCRDEAQYIRETLDTVIAQTRQPTKWIIVNDGSTDGTPAILSEYEQRHSWIQVVTRTNRGHRAVGGSVVSLRQVWYPLRRAPQ